MIRLVKALIIGYVTLWGLDWLRDVLKEEKINNLDDLKCLIKRKL